MDSTEVEGITIF